MTDVSTDVNHQLLLARRPVGLVTQDDFEPVSGAVPELADGEALMRTIYLGMDATVRTWLNRGEGYLPAVEIGEVVRCSGIGRVVATRCAAYEVGDVAYSLPGWQDYAIIRDDLFTTKIEDVSDLRSMMSVFGATGAAAYFGLLDVGRIQAGETVVVSAAGGATGSIAGQIAKIHGCRVVGIAGSHEKCAWVVDELGFDGCINHRSADVARELTELCPDRVDVYFDNVGGAILDAVLGRLNQHGRVVLCGAISTYNDQGRPRVRPTTSTSSRGGAAWRASSPSTTGTASPSASSSSAAGRTRDASAGASRSSTVSTRRPTRSTRSSPGPTPAR